MVIRFGRVSPFLSTKNPGQSMKYHASWLVLFSTLGYAQAFGVYQDLYTRRGTSTPSNISWIGSFQLFMMFAMSLPAGKLYDAGYFHHLQFVGIFFTVFS